MCRVFSHTILLCASLVTSSLGHLTHATYLGRYVTVYRHITLTARQEARLCIYECERLGYSEWWQ